MKFAFVIHNEHFSARMMQMLQSIGIDYFTRWDQAIGKGHGTDPHLGRGGYPSTNSVLMIAFQEEAPLEALIHAIQKVNAEIKRPDDRVRLFQLPLERIV